MFPDDQALEHRLEALEDDDELARNYLAVMHGLAHVRRDIDHILEHIDGP